MCRSKQVSAVPNQLLPCNACEGLSVDRTGNIDGGAKIGSGYDVDKADRVCSSLEETRIAFGDESSL